MDKALKLTIAGSVGGTVASAVAELLVGNATTTCNGGPGANRVRSPLARLVIIAAAGGVGSYLAIKAVL